MRYENRKLRQQPDRGDDISSKLLDLLWAKENQKLTRELIEAEDALSNAGRALTQAGRYTAVAGLSLVDGSNQAEECPSDVDAQRIASALKERIQRWLSAVSGAFKDTEAYPVCRSALQRGVPQML